MEIVEKLLGTLLRIVWKIFLSLLWGCTRLIELGLHHMNNYLQYYITKSKNTSYK